MIKAHEGEHRSRAGRHMAYQCTAGAMTIGYGRNLSSNGISDATAEQMLTEDIGVAKDIVRKLFPGVQELCEARQYVLVDMAFNLGETRLSGFKKMIEAIQNKDFDAAADEMVGSRWYTQVGNRSKTLERIMRCGEY